MQSSPQTQGAQRSHCSWTKESWNKERSFVQQGPRWFSSCKLEEAQFTLIASISLDFVQNDCGINVFKTMSWYTVFVFVPNKKCLQQVETTTAYILHKNYKCKLLFYTLK